MYTMRLLLVLEAILIVTYAQYDEHHQKYDDHTSRIKDPGQNEAANGYPEQNHYHGGYNYIKKQHSEEYIEPNYRFEYQVDDEKTGDHKLHRESRNGDEVNGYYTLKEADGTIREVRYTSNKHTGFNAVVTRSGQPNIINHQNDYNHQQQYDGHQQEQQLQQQQQQQQQQHYVQTTNHYVKQNIHADEYYQHQPNHQDEFPHNVQQQAYVVNEQPEQQYYRVLQQHESDPIGQ